MKKSIRWEVIGVAASIIVLAAVAFVLCACVSAEEVEAQASKIRSAEDRVADATIRKQALDRERTLLAQRLDAAAPAERPALEDAVLAIDNRIDVVLNDRSRALADLGEEHAKLDALDAKNKATPGLVAAGISAAGQGAAAAGVPGANVIGAMLGGLANNWLEVLLAGSAAAAGIEAVRRRRREIGALNVIAATEAVGFDKITNDEKAREMATMLVKLLPGAAKMFEVGKERAEKIELPKATT